MNGKVTLCYLAVALMAFVAFEQPSRAVQTDHANDEKSADMPAFAA